MFILKNCRNTSAILDGSYVTESSTVWIRGREEFTRKRNVLRIEHYSCGCIATECELQMLLQYSDNVASETNWAWHQTKS